MKRIYEVTIDASTQQTYEVVAGSQEEAAALAEEIFYEEFESDAFHISSIDAEEA